MNSSTFLLASCAEQNPLASRPKATKARNIFVSNVAKQRQRTKITLSSAMAAYIAAMTSAIKNTRSAAERLHIFILMLLVRQCAQRECMHCICARTPCFLDGRHFFIRYCARCGPRIRVEKKRKRCSVAASVRQWQSMEASGHCSLCASVRLRFLAVTLTSAFAWDV